MPFWRSNTNPELSAAKPASQLPVNAGKRHLPQPRGPHSVGYVDLMTPGGPDEGSFVRILYPTQEQCLAEHEKWPIWTEDNYLKGMLSFMQVLKFQVNKILV